MLALNDHVLSGIRESLLSENDPQQQQLDSKKTSSLIAYLEILAEAGQDLDFADALTKVLPWILPSTPDVVEGFLLYTIRVLNKRSKFAEAALHLATWRTFFFRNWESHRYGLFALESANVLVGQGDRTSSYPNLVGAYFTNALSFGLWHLNTLYILYHFGNALLGMNIPEAAIIVFEECFLGLLHRYGADHPESLRALAALQSCNISPSHLKHLERLGYADFDQETKLSVAYRHIHLRTPVDLLEAIRKFGLPYQDVLQRFERPTTSTKSDIAVNYYRAIARSIFELGDSQGAREVLDSNCGGSSHLRLPPGILDAVRYSPDPLQASKAFLHFLEREDSVLPHQKEAIRKELTVAGLMHFPSELLAEMPPLISDEDSEMFSRGAYAIVNSVKIGPKSFARKSVALPRYKQKSIRTIIQNEVSVMRNLDHPHIVRLFLTYEDKFRFYIVMQPLADCDLEAFLDQHTQALPTQQQKNMVWKWLLCLSNTLSYIHFEGIRHKDIKPRNVLIKGEDVIFADFGSSHAFLDEGNSERFLCSELAGTCADFVHAHLGTTEGLSIGHTKMYCAPEVLANGKRGRPSDIFSLGCVFTELIVWFMGLTIEEWNLERMASKEETSTVAYSATLNYISEKMDRKLNLEVCSMYRWIIKPMLSESPDDRPTATATSDRVYSAYRKFHGDSRELLRCQKCRPSFWIDKAAIVSESVQSLVISSPEQQDGES